MSMQKRQIISGVTKYNPKYSNHRQTTLMVNDGVTEHHCVAFGEAGIKIKQAVSNEYKRTRKNIIATFEGEVEEVHLINREHRGSDKRVECLVIESFEIKKGVERYE